jgi:hypothetical protein
MAFWILIALVALIIFWLKWGQRWYVEWANYKNHEAQIKTVLGMDKIAGDIVGTFGEIKGVADAINAPGGNFFSRATGAFSSLVG